MTSFSIKKSSLILPLFFCVTTLVIAQDDAYRDRKVDSMVQLLKTQKDTSLVLTYRAIFSTYSSRNADKGKPYLDTAMVLAKQYSSRRIKARLLADQGFYHYQKGEYEQAIPLYETAIEACNEAGNKELLQIVYNSLGICQKYAGDLVGAMDSYLNSIEVSKELGDTDDYIAPSYMNLGSLHAQMGNIEESNRYYELTEKICIEYDLSYGLAITRANMAENKVKQEKYAEAIPLYKHTLEFFKKSNDLPEIGEQYNYLGEVYMELDSLTLAQDFFKKALSVAEELEEGKMLMNSYQNLGKVSLSQSKYSEAIALLKKGEKIAEEGGNELELVTLYPDLAKAHAGLGQHQKAYEYKELHFAKYDSIFQKEKIEQINELEVRYQTEKKEAALALQEEEINTLNERRKVDTLKKSLYGGGMVSAFALLGLSVFGYRQRIKKNKVEREKQEEIYRKEIEHKQKELASQTLHLVQKNTFIQELKENLESIKNSPEKFKTEFRRIVMLLKKENASDKDWQVFKTYFAEVHNDFDEKLKTLYPEITEKEIRLAAFLRMNLTTKEIAATLNVLPDSILKSKYRLKKKIGLDKETDLTQFLSSL